MPLEEESGYLLLWLYRRYGKRLAALEHLERLAQNPECVALVVVGGDVKAGARAVVLVVHFVVGLLLVARLRNALVLGRGVPAVRARLIRHEPACDTAKVVLVSTAQGCGACCGGDSVKADTAIHFFDEL